MFVGACHFRDLTFFQASALESTATPSHPPKHLSGMGPAALNSTKFLGLVQHLMKKKKDSAHLSSEFSPLGMLCASYSMLAADGASISIPTTKHCTCPTSFNSR
jgi:hypothetical protein